MEAKELRIGNWVNLSKDNFKTKYPYEVDGHDIYEVDESGCDDICPIPLTEEWLIKLGFKKSSDTCYVRDRFRYYTNQIPKGATGYSNVVTFKTMPISHVNKVHQLQNLYFGLTQKELEANK